MKIRTSIHLNRAFAVFGVLTLSALFQFRLEAQNISFTDGYHGGVYGHYPYYVTSLILDNLESNSYWAVNLEIEPETWDSVRVHDYEGYTRFTRLYDSLQTANRVENVNPAYGQPYAYNISGESLIRQFSYGMKELRKHFPGSEFTAYSSEEPCFTSALPQILKSFGYSYAVLKNPNTCWGGYTSAFGGELVNWIGPDGTGIITVPRYACEELEPGSTWQTTAWNGSPAYFKTCLDAGIKNPVGMTFQDAGWKNGPWIGQKTFRGKTIEYRTWSDYIRNYSIVEPEQDWHFSQEDVKVSLVWGSQVLQRLAQQVRHTEKGIPGAEKIAAMAWAWDQYPWPAAEFDEAWRTLMLAQHHDCWIVPYNGRRGNTWADKVERWTGASDEICDGIIRQSTGARDDFAEEGTVLRVYNTLAMERQELCAVKYKWEEGMRAPLLLDPSGNEMLAQMTADPVSGEQVLVFKPRVPSLGYKDFRILAGKGETRSGVSVKFSKDGNCVMESDLYILELDRKKGGVIKSFVAKALDNKEFVDKASVYRFNELRGFFYKEGKYHSSSEQEALITVLEDGPLRARVQVEGMIGDQPFTQIVTLVQGEARVDLDVEINWHEAPQIGAWEENNFRAENLEKAFYVDSCKLQALFPLMLEKQLVFKNAPFDVCESRLDDTFFSSWDSIKHAIILNWVDFYDPDTKCGMALFSDHTTAYTHGVDYPAGLVIQYAGTGLWGRNYTVDGPTRVHYALLPHQNDWETSGIWSQGTRFNEPLLAVPFKNGNQAGERSLVKLDREGYEVTAVTVEDNTLYIRIFSASGDEDPLKVAVDFAAVKVEEINLDGSVLETPTWQRTENGGTSLLLTLPRFAFRTLKLTPENKKCF